MKILRYIYSEQINYGCLINNQIYPLQVDPFDGTNNRDLQISKESIPLNDVKLLCPVRQPRQIILVGLNYQAHIEEFIQEKNIKLPQFPIIFMAAQSALGNPEEEIILPFLEHTIDYEAEIVAVIGKEAFQVSQDKALDYIFGYTCGNDISDRDIQKQDKQWTRAKSFPGYKPFGPWIETELDVANLQLTTRVNGEIRQIGNTNMMIFSIPQLIAGISSFMRLYPGDLIFTGTPEGVGSLKPGDCCEIEIKGIGVLRNLIDKK